MTMIVIPEAPKIAVNVAVATSMLSSGQTDLAGDTDATTRWVAGAGRASVSLAWSFMLGLDAASWRGLRVSSDERWQVVMPEKAEVLRPGNVAGSMSSVMNANACIPAARAACTL